MFAKMPFTNAIRSPAKAFLAFAVSLVFIVAALPALGQQPQPGTGRMIFGWHPLMIVAPIIVVLAIIGAMVIFVWLVRWATRGYPFYDQPGLHQTGRGRGAFDILDERFARGEIDKAELEEKRKLIGR
jgi:putative membrane protein